MYYTTIFYETYSFMVTDSEFVSGIRSASRNLVRELGFMGRTIAGTKLSPSAVHALIEIGGSGELSARELSERLLLEKSTISRLVQGLINKGELKQVRSSNDGRSKNLSLSTRGGRTLEQINRFAGSQVTSALKTVDANSHSVILAGIQKFAEALRRVRTPEQINNTHQQLEIKTGYFPGIIGRAAQMHADYYSELVSFGEVFESAVAGGLSEFVLRLNNPVNEIWSVHSIGRILGSISIDGEDLGGGKGHLRWFILEDEIRGSGMGKKLMDQAVEFCDQSGFKETHLWTFKGLDAARSLYERYGFILVEERPGSQWGKKVVEQQFVRELFG